MLSTTIDLILSVGKEFYLKLKDGFHYRCKIVELNEHNITIKDDNGKVSVHAVEQIESLAEWRETGSIKRQSK